jgi:hypothetical protein
MRNSRCFCTKDQQVRLCLTRLAFIGQNGCRPIRLADRNRDVGTHQMQVVPIGPWCVALCPTQLCRQAQPDLRRFRARGWVVRMTIEPWQLIVGWPGRPVSGRLSRSDTRLHRTGFQARWDTRCRWCFSLAVQFPPRSWQPIISAKQLPVRHAEPRGALLEFRL